ncbi:MAG: helix-turn-helix transcriptional regulator [Clostridia bacterium]|nr:helix-turn-helix transcriptional regulator [Clostridia bacterium]
MAISRDWLKDIRITSGKTMKEVSSEAEISECYYCQIESGDRNASVSVAKKIAAALGFSWQKFFE